MEKLPKIVLERLRTDSADEHPDADLLTGFAERTITERERSQVLAHLGQCHECRDVLSLAAAEPNVSVPGALIVKARSPWLRWPALRWGAAAACVVVVGAAVMIGYRARHDRTLSTEPGVVSDKQPEPPTQMAQNQALPAVPAPAARPERSAASSSRAFSASSRYRDTGTKTAPKKEEDKLADRPAVSGRQSGSYAFTASAPVVTPRIAAAQSKAAENRPSGFVFKSDAGNVLARRTDSAAAKDSTIPTGTIPSTSEAGTDQLARVLPPAGTVILGQSKVAAPSPRVPVETAELAKSKAEQVAVSGAAAAATPVPDGKRGVLDTAASASAGLMPDLKTPKWTLSDDGLPQRSFDSGASWEKIQVDHQTGFRALSSNGMDVWVGGQNGLLYHSSDIGLHWARVVPAAQGNILSADITRIDFGDAQHGTITAGEGESWVTVDGGKTWKRN